MEEQEKKGKEMAVVISILLVLFLWSISKAMSYIFSLVIYQCCAYPSIQSWGIEAVTYSFKVKARDQELNKTKEKININR